MRASVPGAFEERDFAFWGWGWMGIDSLRIDQLKMVSFPNWMEIVIRHIIITVLAVSGEKCDSKPSYTQKDFTSLSLLPCVLGGPVY